MERNRKRLRFDVEQRVCVIFNISVTWSAQSIAQPSNFNCLASFFWRDQYVLTLDLWYSHALELDCLFPEYRSASSSHSARLFFLSVLLRKEECLCCQRGNSSSISVPKVHLLPNLKIQWYSAYLLNEVSALRSVYSLWDCMIHTYIHIQFYGTELLSHCTLLLTRLLNVQSDHMYFLINAPFSRLTSGVEDWSDVTSTLPLGISCRLWPL